MNEQLATALGIKFVKKGKSGGRDTAVNVTKGKRCYRIAFNAANSKKLGGYVRVGLANKRIYIVPALENEQGAYKMSVAGGNGKTDMRSIQIGFSAIDNIDAFVGVHELKYFADLDAYFISQEG